MAGGGATPGGGAVVAGAISSTISSLLGLSGRGDGGLDCDGRFRIMSSISRSEKPRSEARCVTLTPRVGGASLMRTSWYEAEGRISSRVASRVEPALMFGSVMPTKLVARRRAHLFVASAASLPLHLACNFVSAFYSSSWGLSAAALTHASIFSEIASLVDSVGLGVLHLTHFFRSLLVET